MKSVYVPLLLAVLVAMVATTAYAAAAEDAQEVEEDHSLQTAIVTPHTDWGTGYTGGPIRALFFIYAGSYGGQWSEPGMRMREVVELGQRFDIKGDAVLYASGGGSGAWNFHGLKTGAERAEKLLEKPYDLYVIGGFPLDKLPAKMQYQILEQVAKGAGLLCVGTAGSEFMTPGRKLQAPASLTNGLPTLEKKLSDFINTYKLGKGRGVWLKYDSPALGPRQEFSFPRLVEYDYWQLLLGRAAQWAAAKEPAVAVTVFDDKPLEVGRVENPTAGQLTLTTTAAQPLPVTVTTNLRRAADGSKEVVGMTSKQTLTAGQPVQVPVAVPVLRAGTYYADVVVKSAKGTETAAAGTINVVSDFGVDNVQMDRSFIERGETINGRAVLRGTPPAGSVLQIRFRDSYDRVLKTQNIPVGNAADYTFSYKSDPFSTILMRVEASLIADKREVEMKDTSFTVPKRRHGQMNFVMWDAGLDPLGYYAWRQLQTAGYNVCLLGTMGGQPRKQAAVLAACDASIVPYSTRILDDKDENGYMKPMCWNHEPVVSEYVNKIVDNQKFQREQGVFVYSLGDEGVTKGCCVHPDCIAAYRKWLQGQYGTIDKLNASWGEKYASFEDVNLLDPKDNMEKQALKTAPARWYDREAFARYNLMHFSGRFVDAYKQLDPLAKTGFEGTGNFGDDYDAILGTNPFYGPYPSIGDDIVRSRASRDQVRSNWMGYSKTGDAISDAAWRMVMKNMDSVWYWMWDGFGSWRGYIRPTIDFWPFIQDVTDEMKPVREGLGDLLLQTPVQHSGIAVLYSLPSALSGQIENSREFIQPQPTHEVWTQLIYECGLDFRYVTDQMLKEGALTNSEFKALVLPMTQALSAEQAQTIRRFVEAGGTVIADVRTGMLDGHCKPVSPASMDELFGIERPGRGKAKTTAVKLSGMLGGQKLDVELPQVRVDLDVKATTAQPLGTVEGVPVGLVNKVGKGQAILLNFQIETPKADDPATAKVRELMAALCGAAGAAAPIKIASPAGEPLPAVESRIWRNGDGYVFGSWRQMQCAWFGPKSGTLAGEPVAAKMALPKAMHVYDLRNHKYLGTTKEVNSKLRWGRASFYAALPYQLKGLSVTLSSAAPKAGDTITANLKLPIPARATEKHPVWVEVIDPQGQVPLWGQQVVMLEKGVGQAQIAVAFNDQPGKWRVRATELFSSSSAEGTWTVK
ncbi:MAG: beta-galactosidase [Armatimonadia bacterium]